MRALASIHLLATAAAAGLVWFVQVVHYPLMAGVGHDQFRDYMRLHANRTSFVVAPIMVTEAVTAVALVVVKPNILTTSGVIMLIGVWTSTVTVQMPCHRRLSRGFDHRMHRRLVVGNWLRTVLWTGRAALALVLSLRTY